MAHDYDYFNNLSGTAKADLMWMFCGDRIGRGQYRDVFVLKLDPRYVVKIENGAQKFANINEWALWCDVVNDKNLSSVSRWLAGCKMISPCGTILFQERTEPAPREKFPRKVPAWLSDMKYQNFGWHKERHGIVCHDYGNISGITIGQKLKLPSKKPEWWCIEDNELKSQMA